LHAGDRRRRRSVGQALPAGIGIKHHAPASAVAGTALPYTKWASMNAFGQVSCCFGAALLLS
jgi:hypothetical protein